MSTDNITGKDNPETLITTAPTLEKACEFRSMLMNDHGRLWVFVMKNAESGYDVLAANEFGGRLSKEVVDDLIVSVVCHQHNIDKRELSIDTDKLDEAFELPEFDGGVESSMLYESGSLVSKKATA